MCIRDRGENEQTLFNTGGWNLIEDLRQQHKIGDLLIVAPEAKRNTSTRCRGKTWPS